MLVGRKIAGEEFRNWVVERYPSSVVSLRCYQKLTGLDLKFLSRERPVANLHPGLLPEYRGVLTFAHALLNQEHYGGWTLHEMNVNWDAGPIYSKIAYPLNFGLSVLANMAAATSLVAAQVIAHWRNETQQAIAQSADSARYVTHLSGDDLTAMTARSLRLGDAKWFVAAYSKLGLRLTDDELRILGHI